MAANSDLLMSDDPVWELGPAPGGMDLSQSPEQVGQGYVPVLNGVDPRVRGAYRRLPGFHRISTTINNSRLLSSDFGGAADHILVDYFMPVVVRYANQPHERRGFVASGNNKLIFKYYDTKTTSWLVRTLVDDLDATFGTRTNFDVMAQGSFLYVSRSDHTETLDSVSTYAKTPHVYWWDEDDAWSPIWAGPFSANDTSTTVRQFAADYNNDGHILYVAVRGSAASAYDGVYRSVNGGPWERIGVFSGGVSAQPGPQCLLIVNHVLFVGGNFTSVVKRDGSTLSAMNVATYDGDWAALSTGVGTSSSTIFAMCVNGSGQVTVGGNNFTVTSSKNLAYWDGAAWQPVFLGTQNANDYVFALVKGSDGLVYIGGTFPNLVNTGPAVVANTQNIGRWSGGGFTAIGAATGANLTVYALAADSTKVYIGGIFTTLHGTSTARIASYTISGGAIAQVGLGFDTTVSCLTTTYRRSDGIAYLAAGGAFTQTNTGGVTVRGVAYYTGSAWAELTPGITSSGSPFATTLLPWRGGRLIVGGTFTKTSNGSVELPNMGVYWDGGESQKEAVVGAGMWKSWGAVTLVVSSQVSTSALFTGSASGKYYGIFVQFIDNVRGFISPPSETKVFKVVTADAAYRRNISITATDRLMLSSKPTAIRVYRTIAYDTPNVTGPYYLDTELQINTDDFNELANTFNFQISLGDLADDSLAIKDQFDPKFGLGGAHSGGAAIGAHKGMLFSLSGSLRPRGSEFTGEAFYDVRWSPPWSSFVEQTTYSGFWRTRLTNSDLPRFIPCGEYLALVARQAVVRFQKSGDYVLIADGPEGLGPCGREAACAIAGDLWMVTFSGELVRMNMSSGSVETALSISRFIQTRWKDKLQSSEIGMAYDASSSMLYITALRQSDDDRPQESIAIHTGTGICTLISDVSWHFVRSGTDPETGRPAMFCIDRRGLIVAPDWTDRGVWESDGTWAAKPFMTLLGTTGTAQGVVTGSIALGGSAYTYTGITSWPTSAGQPLLVDARVYAIADLSTVSEDSQNRYQLLGIGQVIDHTSTGLDVNWDNLLDHGFTGAYSSRPAGSSLRLVVGPVPFQVVFPMLHDPRDPALSDRAVISSMTIFWTAKTVPYVYTPTYEVTVFPWAFVLDPSGTWPYDRQINSTTGLDGIVLPWQTSAQGNYQGNARSIPFSQDADLCISGVEAAGHKVWPCISAFDVESQFELSGVGVSGMLGKADAGTSEARYG